MPYSSLWLRGGNLNLTFQVRTGECIITLQDLTLQIGLKVDELKFIGPTMFDCEEMCDIYLGVAPIKGKLLILSQVKLK